MEKTKLVRALKRQIKATGVSRAALAEAAGVSESHIRSWSEGTVPSVLNADALLRALRVRLVIGDPNGPDLEM